MKYYNLILIICLSFLFLLGGCGQGNPVSPGNREQPDTTDTTNDNNPPVNLHLYADFQTKAPNFYTSRKKMDYQFVGNPDPDKVNSSPKCARITTTVNQYELVYSEPLGGVRDKYVYGTFDFSTTTTFSIKVYTSVPGDVIFRIENPWDWHLGRESVTVDKKQIPANRWTKLTFTFSRKQLQGKKFGKIVLLFDAGDVAHDGVYWYFDDIKGPKLDKQPSVFHRVLNRPIISTEPNTWYDVHVANVTILTPKETGGDIYKMFLRGTTFNNSENRYHSNILYFYQDGASFSPIGQWNVFEGNPVIKHGPSGSIVSKALLGPTAVESPDGNIYIYYNARYANKVGTALVGAVSTDGGKTFTKFSTNPLMKGGHARSAFYYQNKLYLLYYGGVGRPYFSLSVLESPYKLEDKNPIRTIRTGGPGMRFSYIGGAKIFRVSEDDRWFMIFDASKINEDFSFRFHAAYSTDLKHWTIVENHVPLFTRGAPGQWDQGAIWTGDLIEYHDSLYIYYEGWGKKGAVRQRNNRYFKGGFSQVGVAVASVDDFLAWVDGAGPSHFKEK